METGKRPESQPDKSHEKKDNIYLLIYILFVIIILFANLTIRLSLQKAIEKDGFDHSNIDREAYKQCITWEMLHCTICDPHVSRAHLWCEWEGMQNKTSFDMTFWSLSTGGGGGGLAIPANPGLCRFETTPSRTRARSKSRWLGWVSNCLGPSSLLGRRCSNSWHLTDIWMCWGFYCSSLISFFFFGLFYTIPMHRIIY